MTLNSLQPYAAYQLRGYVQLVPESYGLVRISIDATAQKNSPIFISEPQKGKTFFEKAGLIGWLVGFLAGSAALVASAVLELPLGFSILLFSGGALIYLVLQQLSKQVNYETVSADCSPEPVTNQVQKKGFRETFGDSATNLAAICSASDAPSHQEERIGLLPRPQSSSTDRF